MRSRQASGARVAATWRRTSSVCCPRRGSGHSQRWHAESLIGLPGSSRTRRRSASEQHLPGGQLGTRRTIDGAHRAARHSGRRQFLDQCVHTLIPEEREYIRSAPRGRQPVGVAGKPRIVLQGSAPTAVQNGTQPRVGHRDHDMTVRRGVGFVGRQATGVRFQAAGLCPWRRRCRPAAETRPQNPAARCRGIAPGGMHPLDVRERMPCTA